VKIGTSCGHAMLNDIEKWYTEEWSARTWWLATYPVSVLRTIYTHYEWEHSSESKERKLVATDGLGKWLHRQKSDKIRQTTRWTFRVAQ
jgi:hypothetical protein